MKRMENTGVPFALKEPLKLDSSTEVPGSVVQVLASHQLEGIRFMHRGLAQNKGVILNDESGLGKTHQIVGYLSAAIKSADKTAVVCSNLQRLHHWMYHFNLLTNFKTSVLDGQNYGSLEQIILITFESFQKQPEILFSKKNDIKFLIVDETKGVSPDLLLFSLISKFVRSKKIFLLTSNLLADVARLSLRLKLCHVQFFQDSLNDFIEEALLAKRSLTKAKRLKLFFLTRSVLLRRFRSHYKSYLPLIVKKEFDSCFAAWKIANDLNNQAEHSQPLEQAKMVPMREAELTKSNSDQLFNFDYDTNHEEFVEDEVDRESSLNRAIVGEAENVSLEPMEVSQVTDDEGIAAVSVDHKVSEPLFDFEQSTEDMPKLEVESSDSETKSTIEEVRGLTCIGKSDTSSQFHSANIEVPETERASQATEHQQNDSEGYLEFGQALVCTHSESGSSTETIIRKPSSLSAEEKYNFPIDRLLRRKSPSSSSAEVEIVSRESATANAIVLSSASSNAAEREKSPDMFSDTEEEEGNETVKNSTQDSFMDLLLKSPVDLEKNAKPALPNPIPRLIRSNVSTPIAKLIYGHLHGELIAPAKDGSSNDIFADVTVKEVDPNRTDIFEITDNNAFGNKIQVHAEKDSMSPLRDSGDVQFVSIIRVADDPIEILDLESNVCTPKSQQTKAKKTPSTSGSISSTPRGWLTKTSRHSSSDSGSPRTPTNARKTPAARRSGGSTSLKRKKLENWFRDDDDFVDCERASTSVNRRKSAPSGSGTSTRRSSPRKKCFQERIVQRYNQILVSPSGIDSDFE